MRALTRWLLAWAERLYLHAHGWDPVHSGRAVDADKYLPPSDYAYRKYDNYDRRHAVNAQHYVYSVDGKGPKSFTRKKRGPSYLTRRHEEDAWD